MAVHWAIHAPHFLDAADADRIEADFAQGRRTAEAYLDALADPAMTNRNFHVHMLSTTRVRDDAAGGLGRKIRELDHIVHGPEELKKIRAAWEVRVNAALKRVGSRARIDLRSYAEMARAGEAPRGLVAQQHQGPDVTAIKRRKDRRRKHVEPAQEERRGSAHPKDRHRPEPMEVDAVAARRASTRKANEEIWSTWLQVRALERERARVKEEGRKSAAEREVARRVEAQRQRAAIAEARTRQEARQAMAEATHLPSVRGENDLERIIAAAARGDAMEMPEGEDIAIDPETYAPPGAPTPFETAGPMISRALTQIRLATLSGWGSTRAGGGT